MLCEKCGKNTAQFYYSENVNGESKKLALCKRCASEINFLENHIFPDPFKGYTLLNPFGDLKKFENAVSGSVKKTEETKCDLCGLTMRQILKEGKAGCPRCYETFSDELGRVVSGIHGNTHHKGRVPHRLKSKTDGDDRINGLRQKIADAVKTEDYEEAARLRDMIRDIESRGEMI